MKIVAFIPARYNSTRLPGKPLRKICGKTMIQRVWESVNDSGLINDIYIATDDDRIKSHCEEFGANVVMTPENLQSGTDRIEYAYRKLNLNHSIIVNIQGDEVLIKGSILDDLLKKFVNSGADVGTLTTVIKDSAELFDNSVVKVVLRHDSTALYFSRNIVPYVRDINEDKWFDFTIFHKHIGIYSYTIDSLKRFVELEQSNLEKAEKLEQLRLLQDGAKYLCIDTNANLIGVDTEDDILKVERFLKTNRI